MEATRARVGQLLQRALDAACDLARIRGHSTIGTDHLLVHLVACLPDFGRAAGRPIHSPLEPDSSGLTETDTGQTGDLEVDGALRESRWRVFVLKGNAASPTAPGLPRWHPGVRAAITRALADATTDGMTHAGGLDLLRGALLGGPDGRAHQLLRQYNIEPSVVLEAQERAPAGIRPGPPSTQLADVLWQWGVAVPAGRRRARLLFRLIGNRMDRRPYASPTLAALEHEARRQAVRLGHHAVTTAHLVLTALQLDEQLAEKRYHLVGTDIAANRAGSVLSEYRVTYRDAATHLAGWPVIDLPTVVDKGRYPLWTVAAAHASEQALADATRQRIRVGSSHLLATALSDPDGPAGRLVHQLGTDPHLISRDLHR